MGSPMKLTAAEDREANQVAILASRLKAASIIRGHEWTCDHSVREAVNLLRAARAQVKEATGSRH